MEVLLCGLSGARAGWTCPLTLGLMRPPPLSGFDSSGILTLLTSGDSSWLFLEPLANFLENFEFLIPNKYRKKIEDPKPSIQKEN